MIESQRHSYHLVDPSPWPISGSLGALATTVGGVMYMHSFQGGATLLSLGLIFILYTMFVWWRDVLRESTLEGHHTKVAQLGLRYGFILFIVSEVMFLFAFFLASSHSSLAPTISTVTWARPIIFLILLFFLYRKKRVNYLFQNIYFVYCRNKNLQQIYFFIKIFFFVLVFLRVSFLLFKNIVIMGVTPAELGLLDWYLSQPDQDPEWVQFVRERLETSPPAEFERRFRSFINIELCASTRETIISLYKIIFYGRADPLFFISVNELDSILRFKLENVEFNHKALSAILEELCQDRHESTFYSNIIESDYFQEFWKLQHHKDIERKQRDQLYFDVLQLEKRISWLTEENKTLKAILN